LILSIKTSYLFQRSFPSSFLGPDVFPSTLFPKIISLYSSPNVRDHVSHPYKITRKIIVLHILIFVF
jgi:hypothetical protein